MDKQFIRKVRLLNLVCNEDDRGSLVAIEEQDNLPFSPKRIFFISVHNPSSVRAGHASSSEELIVAVNGAVTIDLDNGEQQMSLRLEEKNKALWLRPGVWLKLKEFTPGTILLVAASLLFSETQHFEQPQRLSVD
jgi:hypothetical protein